MRELKKFSLRQASNFLSEAEMKRVTGGYSEECIDDIREGTCGYRHPNGYQCVCGLSKDTALYLFDAYGGYWCCDSCGSTGYCP